MDQTYHYYFLIHFPPTGPWNQKSVFKWSPEATEKLSALVPRKCPHIMGITLLEW